MPYRRHSARFTSQRIRIPVLCSILLTSPNLSLRKNPEFAALVWWADWLLCGAHRLTPFAPHAQPETITLRERSALPQPF
jgi:hypothetical protein